MFHDKQIFANLQTDHLIKHIDVSNSFMLYVTMWFVTERTIVYVDKVKQVHAM